MQPRRRGGTEYFARLTIDNGSLFSATPYRELRQSDRFGHPSSSLVGPDVLAKAYFDGDFPALKREFVAKTGKSWDAYAKALETNQYTTADSYL